MIIAFPISNSTKVSFWKESSEGIGGRFFNFLLRLCLCHSLLQNDNHNDNDDYYDNNKDYINDNNSDNHVNNYRNGNNDDEYNENRYIMNDSYYDNNDNNNNHNKSDRGKVTYQKFIIIEKK